MGRSPSRHKKERSSHKKEHSRHKRRRSHSRDRHSKHHHHDKEVSKRYSHRSHKEYFDANGSSSEEDTNVAESKLNQELGYGNEDNPFGDPNLSKQFVWKAKVDKAKQEGLQLKKKTTAEKLEEIKKVKLRREEREKEKMAWEAEKERMMREQDMLLHIGQEHKEEEFHLTQDHERALIRMKEGRAEPIDKIIRNLIDDVSVDVEITEPYTVISSLDYEELQTLDEALKFHRYTDKKNEEYLNCVDTVLKAEMKRRVEYPDHVAGEVLTDVEEMVKVKNGMQLADLKQSIEQKLRTKGVDADYWSGVLRVVELYSAKWRLDELHQENLQHQLQLLEEVEMEKGKTHQKEKTQPTDGGEIELSDDEKSEKEEEEEVSGGEVNEDEDATYIPPLSRDRCYSPGLLDPEEVGADETVRDTFEDKEWQYKNREEARARFRASQEKVMSTDDVLEAKIVKEGADDEENAFEEDFTGEVALGAHSYTWADRYRPRKPRFFNRVHTGYEWNKYNRAHYDHDNPPPKVVQGYKFNVFYPDLIDPVKDAPTYTLTRSPEDLELGTVTVTFKAGPPYEDIAFRIVNKEWEYNPRHGFRCSFERGIMRLYIRFKRYRYRR